MKAILWSLSLAVVTLACLSTLVDTDGDTGNDTLGKDSRHTLAIRSHTLKSHHNL